MDNYRLQVEGAQKYFLRYDQEALIRKLRLKADEEYLYTQMLGKSYRIHRRSGNVERLDDVWTETNSHGEVMTLLDLVCDSKEGRFVSGRWVNMLSFGRMFHQNLMGNGEDTLARKIQENPDAFRRICETMGAGKAPGGDIGVTFPLFEGLEIALQFWEGDEEFAPRVRFLWDENATMYLKYETMWYALGMLKTRLLEKME